MSLINVTNLTFGYEGSYDNIFENVSFQIDSNWKLGFIGRNGRGKTTFLNLLLGKYEYKGKIKASVKFEYFPYTIKDKSLNTIDVVDSVCFDYELWELLCELSLLEVSEEVLYRPFDTLSNGEQTKVLMATLFLKENNFLLIDEPTNHLDAEGRKIVSNYLKSKKGFILVSHDRAFIDECVDHVLSINKAKIEVVNGNYSSWFYNKELEDSFELEKNSKLKKEIARLSQTARQKAQWSDKVEATKIGSHSADRGHIGAMAAKMMKRSKAIEKRRNAEIEEKSKLLKNIEDKEELKIIPLEYHSNTLVNMRDFSIRYNEKMVFQDFNLKVEKGDRIALFGKNGSGKSSVIKLIMGENISYNGVFEKASGLIISYISQDTSFLKGSLNQFAEDNCLDLTIFKINLRKLDFSRVQFDKPMEDFSEGQKKKVLIAKSLSEKAHLYIWDEPLNFIDVISRTQIEELILKHKPTILFAEHDKMFSDKIFTKAVYL